MNEKERRKYAAALEEARRLRLGPDYDPADAPPDPERRDWSHLRGGGIGRVAGAGLAVLCALAFGAFLLSNPSGYQKGDAALESDATEVFAVTDDSTMTDDSALDGECEPVNQTALSLITDQAPSGAEAIGSAAGAVSADGVTYVAAPLSNGSTALVSYDDDSPSTMEALNGSARTHLALPASSASSWPAAGDEALACAS